MSFAENLRKARTAAGMTQQQVADKMGVTKSTYCGYETEKRQPDVPKIKQLSEILGVPSDYLLETEKAPTLAGERDPTDRQIKAAFFRGVDPDLTEADQDDLWNDATEYFQIKVAQRKRKNGEH